MCPTHGRALSTPPNLFRANNLTAGDIIERSSRVRNPCGDDCYKVPAHENQASASLTKWTDRELENLKMFASALDAPTVCALAASMYPRTCSEVRHGNTLRSPSSVTVTQIFFLQTFIALHSLDLDPSPLSNNEQAGNSDKPAKRSWKKFPDASTSVTSLLLHAITPDLAIKIKIVSVLGLVNGAKEAADAHQNVPAASRAAHVGRKRVVWCAIPKGVLVSTIRRSVIQTYVAAAVQRLVRLARMRDYCMAAKRYATRVVMKQYQWGPAWGLILEEPVKTGEFIDEYIGEIITDAEYKARLPIATYLGRNYFFSLDSTRTIDGARASNNTRYINHAAKAAEGLNVDTSMRFVEGEPRLGFFARKKIKAGEELLFDYGEFYWIGDTEGVSERLMVSPGRPKGQRRKTSRSRSRTETVETSDTSRTEDSITEPSRKGSRDTSETDDDSVGSTSTERGMVNLARHGAKKSAWPAFQPAVRREVGRGSYLAGESDEEDELVYDSGV
ncbi:Histone-lysine N-methyltransferase mes-4 [Tulasnella sp. JGI-2019a]|nr:Histone-lysine N-methyltransferase mes-4 [Tulasnella sp. JGI-2019a]